MVTRFWWDDINTISDYRDCDQDEETIYDAADYS